MMVFCSPNDFFDQFHSFNLWFILHKSWSSDREQTFKQNSHQNIFEASSFRTKNCFCRQCLCRHIFRCLSRVHLYLRDLNTVYFRKIMSHKSVVLLVTAIMSNRQKYHCYIYSEQATENIPWSKKSFGEQKTIIDSQKKNDYNQTNRF